MKKLIKVFSIFTLIWSSVTIINGCFLFILICLSNIRGDFDTRLISLFAVEFFGKIQLILTVAMIAFICFLQSLWILHQLKDRN